MRVYVHLLKSPLKDKKWRAVFTQKNKEILDYTDFGHSSYGDYTTHGDEERKRRFLTRFRGLIEKYKDEPTAPTTLSKWVLWNKKTVEESFKDYKRHYGLQ